MSDLITGIIDTRTPIEVALDIDADGNTTARKLYAFLELAPQNYARWCKSNIVENEFAEENVDFTPFFINEECGGQATTDYKLTAHFAKKLSVKGNSAKAEEAREYFTTVEERVKQKAIDFSQLSPELQMFNKIFTEVAEQQLEQKRQAEQLNKAEKKIDTMVETFSTTTDSDGFQAWVNKCIAKIAESPKFDKGIGKNVNYASARNESYARLKSKWNCNLDDRVFRAKGRAMEHRPEITKTELNAINKLTIIANDKTLKPIYDTVIKEMMIAYCVNG